MRAPRIGVFLHESRVTVVAVDARDRVSRVTVEGAGDPGAALAAELRARGLRGGRLRLGLDRRVAIVKAIELPRTERGDLARMIAFELERHVPFPPEQTRFAWTALPGAPEGPRRVLIAVAEARTVERAWGLATAAGRRPGALTIAAHALPALLPRGLPRRRGAWVHCHDGVVDLLLLEGRALHASRQASAAPPEDLGREIRRTLTVARWAAPDAVWLSGAAAEPSAGREQLAAALGIPVVAPPLRERAATLAAALSADDGAGLLALGLALERGRPPLDLLPPAARPWAPSRGQTVTAGMLALVAAAGLGWGLACVVGIERYLERVSAEIRRLETDARTADALGTQLASKRRLLAALDSIEQAQVPVLPVLRELTETIPTDAWLQSLSLDRQGIELAGQADGASALVPLLEASRRLERAELASPVTKTQGKEHFHIRAGWER